MMDSFSQDLIATLIEKIKQVSYCENVILIDTNDQIITHNFQDENSALKIKTLMREAIRLSNKFTRESRAGRHKNILLEGNFGKILIAAGPIKGCSAAITGSKFMNTGMIHALLEESRVKLMN